MVSRDQWVILIKLAWHSASQCTDTHNSIFFYTFLNFMPKQCGLLSPSNVDSEDTKHLPIDTIRPFYQTECDFDHQPTQLSIDFDKYAKNTAHWAQIPFCTDKIVVLNGFESKLLLSEFMLKEGGSVVWQIEHEPHERSIRQQQSKEDSANAW